MEGVHQIADCYILLSCLPTGQLRCSGLIPRWSEITGHVLKIFLTSEVEV
jgi:hypothetical protein